MSDWADDDSMSAEETRARFEALNPTPTTGPDETDTTHEQFAEMWERADPVQTKVPRDCIEEIIYAELMRDVKTGTGYVPPWVGRAADSVWEFVAGVVS